jgi:osmotically-inducible protein OsmY
MKNKTLPLLIALLAGPLVVLASPETDRKIEDAAKTSYNCQTVLADQVSIKSKDGVVTLTGTVQDKEDKALAQDTMENIPGVTKVKNDIVVESTYPEHSDAWMALKIRTRLLMKSDVSAIDTTVDVKDGVVTLGGTAENQAQKELTTIYAQEIDWVKSVNNEMAVKDQETVNGKPIDDASITSQVKYALRNNKVTTNLKTDVVTTKGVTTITGVAKSDEEKALVTKLARDVHGNKSVTNNMTVKS